MNKGVSTIIATILLLLIVIALVGVAYLWISGLLTGKTAKVISISDISCNTTGHITVVLSNDGTQNIVDADIKVLVDNVDRSDNYEFATIAPHTTATVVSNVTESTDQSHTVLIVSPSNNARQDIYC